MQSADRIRYAKQLQANPLLKEILGARAADIHSRWETANTLEMREKLAAGIIQVRELEAELDVTIRNILSGD